MSARGRSQSVSVLLYSTHLYFLGWCWKGKAEKFLGLEEWDQLGVRGGICGLRLTETRTETY